MLGDFGGEPISEFGPKASLVGDSELEFLGNRSVSASEVSCIFLEEPKNNSTRTFTFCTSTDLRKSLCPSLATCTADTQSTCAHAEGSRDTSSFRKRVDIEGTHGCTGQWARPAP